MRFDLPVEEIDGNVQDRLYEMIGQYYQASEQDDFQIRERHLQQLRAKMWNLTNKFGHR